MRRSAGAGVKALAGLVIRSVSSVPVARTASIVLRDAHVRPTYWPRHRNRAGARLGFNLVGTAGG